MVERRLRAVRYIRVSTEDQAREGYSLESQDKRLVAFCQAQDWEMIGPAYRDDSTGMNTDRQGYQSMLADMRQWDVVIAVKGDRFHRSIDNARAFWAEMRGEGKQVWTIAEGRLDDPENASKWLSQMMTSALLPEFESRQISERVLPGMEIGKEKNLHQGRPPLGFAWNKIEGEFILTAWAKKFKSEVDSLGVDAARRANPRPRGKSKGKFLSKSAAYRLLENIKLFEAGGLVPNRKRTPSGTWSKFKKV